MAVAVKTSPGARSAGTPGGLALLSLVGVVYLVATLAIVFKLLPSLWWTAWDAIGLTQYQFVGGALLAIVGLAAAAGLLWAGVKLLGTHQPPGVRAGVFVGFTGLFLVLLLTRWAGRAFEGYVFTQRSLSPFWGAVLTGVTGGVLLAAWLYAFTRPWTLAMLIRLEEAGWFHATTYKGNQGRMVRRGTMIGILLLATTGIYSLMHSGSLRRGASDWVLTIPFTGKVAIENMGDAREFVIKDVPVSAKSQVQIKWLGIERDSKLRPDQIMTFEQYKEAVKAALTRSGAPASVIAEIEKAGEGDPVEYLLTVNKAVHAELDQVLSGTTFHDDIKRRLREVDRTTSWTDMTKLMTAVQKEASTAKKTDELGWTLAVPLAVPVVDRAALLVANEQTDKGTNVVVGVKRNPDFKLEEGKVVSASAFDAEEKRVYLTVAEKRLDRENPADRKALASLDEVKDGADFRKQLTELIDATPEGAPLKLKLTAVRDEIAAADDVPDRGVPLLVPHRDLLAPATGTLEFASIPLLPAVQFTLPLVLLAASIWLAWRVVNLPVFADFLIATEAEMNKVSWTTQKRLVQDTIVVLVTVVLLAGFLFSMDVMWKKVLSWKHIGVLYIPEDKGEKKKMDEKKW
jgi:preprotein translocase SecE subunit